MKETYFLDQTYEGQDFTKTPLNKGDYENCTFKNCDFGNHNFIDFKFVDCAFENCNLSLANIAGTAFQHVNFKDCKMLGLRFDAVHPFGLSFTFEGCQLNHSSFFQLKIKKTIFKDSQLQETDFVETDLSNAIFENCDLSRAVFNRTLLEKADFRTAYNYSIDPENNKIKKAKFSIAGISGLLNKYDILIEE